MLILKEMKRAGVHQGWDFDEPEFQLRRKDGLIHLGNVYASYYRVKGDHRSECSQTLSLRSRSSMQKEFLGRKQEIGVWPSS